MLGLNWNYVIPYKSLYCLVIPRKKANIYACITSKIVFVLFWYPAPDIYHSQLFF